jgi:hypothetical protein
MDRERRHRCGGVLVTRHVQIVSDDESGDFSLGYVVHGFVCNGCHEQLIDRATALQLQASQIPTVGWRLSEVTTTKFDVTAFGLAASVGTGGIAA